MNSKLSVNMNIGLKVVIQRVLSIQRQNRTPVRHIIQTVQEVLSNFHSICTPNVKMDFYQYNLLGEHNGVCFAFNLLFGGKKKSLSLS